ncbi:hypothetical protein PG984_014135 [Apiospora sp. TS-2023a]
MIASMPGAWDDEMPNEPKQESRRPWGMSQPEDDSQSVVSQDQDGQASPEENESWDWSGESPANPDLDAPGWSTDALNINSRSAGSVGDDDLAPKVNVSDPFPSDDPFDNPFNSSNDDSNANTNQSWGDDSGAGVASTDSPAVDALADNGLVDDEIRATGIQTGILPERVIKPSDEALSKMTKEERIVALQQYEDERRKAKGK